MMFSLINLSKSDKINFFQLCKLLSTLFINNKLFKDSWVINNSMFNKQKKYAKRNKIKK